MAWQTEIVTMLRYMINDASQDPTYSDERLESLIVLAAQLVQFDNADLSIDYDISMSDVTITPDPTTPTRDNTFISLLLLKTACFVDESTARTKAAAEGIRAVCGPASLAVSGNLAGFLKLLEVGPCKAYADALRGERFGSGNNAIAIMSPFVSNQFTPYFSTHSKHYRDY